MPNPQPAETRLGRLIRMAREEKKVTVDGVEKPMTQKALGLALDDGLATNQSTVSAWEGGTVIPGIPHLLAICRALDIDPTALITAAEDDARDKRDAEQLTDA